MAIHVRGRRHAFAFSAMWNYILDSVDALAFMIQDLAKVTDGYAGDTNVITNTIVIKQSPADYYLNVIWQLVILVDFSHFEW